MRTETQLVGLPRRVWIAAAVVAGVLATLLILALGMLAITGHLDSTFTAKVTEVDHDRICGYGVEGDDSGWTRPWCVSAVVQPSKALAQLRVGDCAVFSLGEGGALLEHERACPPGV